eukprot:310188_1
MRLSFTIIYNIAWTNKQRSNTLAYGMTINKLRMNINKQRLNSMRYISKRIQTNDSLALIVKNTEAMARLCGHDLHSLDDLDLEFMKRKYIVFINKMLIALMTASKAAK